MKKRLIAGICAALLICLVGAAHVLAAGAEGLAKNSLPPGRESRFEGVSGGMVSGQMPAMPEGTEAMMPARMGGGPNGFGKELTDEQKAEMETARAEREEKLNAFTNALSDEQKALYQAMIPDQPSEGGEKPDKSAMRAKREAFMASLTDAQKTAYQELEPIHMWKR
ncbi:MAG: hypothetical protein LBR74_09980 [Eubacterium sp.]|jgi:hypothetical protein|nr:hypothetical protein [Eubacterium sp.]